MNRYLFTLVFLLSIAFSSTVSAQSDVIHQKACVNESYKPQIDSLKSLLASQGFALVREASMTMESEYEMPVVIPLTQGAWYHFVFIGDPTSKLYEVRMYDWGERQVFYKKNMWGDVDGNIIDYTYIPQVTQYHMIKPVQVNKKKKKDLCGYIMMFKKVK